MRRGEAPLLLRLRHAFPHCLLESSLCLCPPHWLLERVGVFRGVDHYDWRSDGFHRRPGIPLRLHHRTQRLCHSCGVRSAGNFSARWEREREGSGQHDFCVLATHVCICILSFIIKWGCPSTCVCVHACVNMCKAMITIYHIIMQSKAAFYIAPPYITFISHDNLFKTGHTHTAMFMYRTHTLEEQCMFPVFSIPDTLDCS